MKKMSLLLTFLMFHLIDIGQDRSLYEKQLFILGEDTLPCRILSPLDFKEGKKYPLIIFLHGAGERGNNNEAQLTWGADLFLDSINRIKFPAIVVFPQCPQIEKWAEYNKSSKSDSTGYMWSSQPSFSKSLQLVSSFIDTLLTSRMVDKKGFTSWGFQWADLAPWNCFGENLMFLLLQYPYVELWILKK